MLVRDAEIDALLQAWDRDPHGAMERLPEKRDARSGQLLESAATARAVLFGDRLATLHTDARQRLYTGCAGWSLLEPPTQLRRLEEMEAEGLTTAQCREPPWSDSTWPLACGLAAARYADLELPATQDHEALHNYVQERPLSAIVQDGLQSEIDLLAPSEKYDLLLGNLDAPLTSAMWRMGQLDVQREGLVDRHSGLGYGWAPASFMLPRPRRTIVLPGPDTRFIVPFLPSDLKALGSLLWATTQSAIRVAQAPSAPMWHLTLVHQLGVARRSLIIDALHDHEIWNQPLCEYSYSYFNPLTRRATRVLQNATVRKSAFPRDPFKPLRAAQGVSLVGIAMDVTYVTQTAPNHNFSNSSNDDRRLRVRYLYDLELDDAGAIIGGAWYTGRPPDLLWLPAFDKQPRACADHLATGAWNQPHPVPNSWREAGRIAAQKGQPLEKIISALFALVK